MIDNKVMNRPPPKAWSPDDLPPGGASDFATATYDDRPPRAIPLDEPPSEGPPTTFAEALLITNEGYEAFLRQEEERYLRLREEDIKANTEPFMVVPTHRPTKPADFVSVDFDDIAYEVTP